MDPTSTDKKSFWTPKERNEFISEAVTSAEMRGNRGPYYFNTYPKDVGQNMNTEIEARKSLMTETFARTIYTKTPSYKKISVGFYYMLVDKVRNHLILREFIWRDIFIIIKGANAYMYLTKDKETFPCSDLDIMIYINPSLSDELFNELKTELHTIVVQCLSQFKRLLDNMFFINSVKDTEIFKNSQLFDDATIEAFKKDHIEELNKLSTDTLKIISPFENDKYRNDCSRHSFILANSKHNSNNVVKVDVPHFDKCEKIPLRKTPFFCSYNKTIDFKRDGQNLEGKFDLYRIRFNNLFVEFDADGKKIKEEKVAADFIDVSISSKSDAELIDFWNTARCEFIMDPDACDWKVLRENQWQTITCWLVMPNITSCLNDLYKMLNVYECPDSKKAKREARYNALKQIIAIN